MDVLLTGWFESPVDVILESVQLLHCQRSTALPCRDRGGACLPKAQGASQSQVDVLDLEGVSQAQHQGALEQLASGFMLAASEDDEVVF